VSLAPWIGLALLPLAALGMVVTGLPAFLVLLASAALGALVALATGGGALLGALPGRFVALLESDLLQALPLFVLVGALVNRLPLADILYRTLRRLYGRLPAAPELAALTLGAFLAPMCGSVGASVAALSRSVRPRLEPEIADPAERVVLLAAASTLGVVVPPSLVLILLGDAMMQAHTIALNAASRFERVVNTQDIFRAAALPAALVVAGWALVALWRARGRGVRPASGVTRVEAAVALAATAFVGGALLGVATGRFYAVEAAAMACAGLFLGGLASGRLDRAALSAALAEAMAITGALFALLIAATAFTLVLRVLGVDRLVSQALAALPGGAGVGVVAALALIGLAALVLDAFEIIFVVVPLVMPGVLMKATDASWVSALTILALQASFLLPPLGYAVMMARAGERAPLSTRRLAAALAPYLLVCAATLALTVAIPQIASRGPESQSAPTQDAPRKSLEDFKVDLPTQEDAPQIKF
jgi:TRAP-type mannitol/chloroaromatic compound transport system permease large subunit